MRSSLESSTKRATRNAKKSVDITDRCPIRHSPTVTTRWRYVKSYLSQTAAPRFALWLFGNRHRLLALEGIHKGLAAEPQCCSYAPGSQLFRVLYPNPPPALHGTPASGLCLGSADGRREGREWVRRWRSRGSA